MAQFDRSHTSRNLAVSCKRYKTDVRQSEILVENRDFFTPLIHNNPLWERLRIPYIRIVFARDAMQAYVVMRCLSVCVSVTFVNSVKTSKYINNFFHHRVATPF